MIRGLLVRRLGLRRSGPIRRRPRPLADRVSPGLHHHVVERDSYRCIATRFDLSHRCQGVLTVDHVPERDKNTLDRRAPSNRFHLVAACLGANQPEGWCNTHREEERAWLELFYGSPPYPEGPDAVADITH
jgi:hypothetical protein